MKYNHQRAEQICSQLDPNNKVYTDISKNLQKIAILPDFILSQSRKAANKGLNDEDLENELIIIAEAIYQHIRNIESNQFSQYSNKTQDQLFDLILDNLLHGLSEEQLRNVIGDIGAIYEVEI